MKWLIPLSILLLISCSKDDNPVTPQGWQGSFNNSGFPNVAGTYAFTTKEITGSCSDGSSGSSSSLSFNLVVTQDKNTLLFTQTGAGSSVGITVIEASPLQGTVDKEGGFVANQNAIVTMSGIQGQVTLSYHIDGKFIPTGWSGNYTYSAYLQSYNVTCNYTTTFTGDKISSLGKKGEIFPVLKILL